MASRLLAFSPPISGKAIAALHESGCAHESILSAHPFLRRRGRPCTAQHGEPNQTNFQPTHFWEGEGGEAHPLVVLWSYQSFSPPISGKARAAPRWLWELSRETSFSPPISGKARAAKVKLRLCCLVGNFQPTHFWEGEGGTQR
mgnify:CR=1 FL=1